MSNWNYTENYTEKYSRSLTKVMFVYIFDVSKNKITLPYGQKFGLCVLVVNNIKILKTNYL